MEDEREGVWSGRQSRLNYGVQPLRSVKPLFTYGKGRNEVSIPPSTIGIERLYGAQQPNNVLVRAFGSALSHGCLKPAAHKVANEHRA